MDEIKLFWKFKIFIDTDVNTIAGKLNFDSNEYINIYEYLGLSNSLEAYRLNSIDEISDNCKILGMIF